MKKNILTISSLTLAVSVILLSACSANQVTTKDDLTLTKTEMPPSLFSETAGILPSPKRARRKWDGPIVGDLDGDGLQDLILTEHAHEVNVYWNEGGKFSQPQTLISGDMHGTAIADFDNNGLVEVVIAQGGGNGSNPRKPKHYEITKKREFSKGDILTHFEKGRGRSVKALDANQNGVLDLFLTGFAMPAQRETGANHFYSNDGTGDFTFRGNLPYSQRLSYKSVVTDINQDNDPDIIIFGGGAMVLAKGNDGYTFSDATNESLGQIAKTDHVSAIAQLDFDGDGDTDLAISRAKHQFEHQRFYDTEHQRFAFFARFQPFLIGDITIKGNFILENLQMAFPDFDIYIGENKRKIDIKGRNDISSHDWDLSGSNTLELSPDEANGWPLDVCVGSLKIADLPKTSKTGLYIGYLGNDVWRMCSQTRSATGGVVLNVIDAPASSIVKPLPVKLLENQNGRFVEVSTKMGIDIEEPTASTVAADFDNDGWSDLLFIPYGNMAQYHQPILYLNREGQGFSRMHDHGIIVQDLGATGAGADVIDFDKDGDLDLVTANERGRWRLFENHSTELANNHFIGFAVNESPSGKATKFGAKASVEACGRKFIRTVGDTSSSYAVAYNNDLLFGLGACKKIDSVVVRWTNGEQVEFVPSEVDKYIQLPSTKYAVANE